MERELAAWVLVVILNRTATIGLKEKTIFEARLDRGRSLSCRCLGVKHPDRVIGRAKTLG